VNLIALSVRLTRICCSRIASPTNNDFTSGSIEHFRLTPFARACELQSSVGETVASDYASP
jgi:hypothetical protein